MRLWILAALLPVLGQGQIVVTALDGTNTTTLTSGGVFQLAQSEPGQVRTLTIRVTNAGAANVTLTQFSADGAGFTMSAPHVPIVLAPGRFTDGALTFSGATAASYSANLQVADGIDDIGVILLASVVSGPVLTISADCAGTAAGAMDFGTVTRGTLKTCGASLKNGSGQPMPVTGVSVTGTGFSLTNAPAAPFTLAVGQSVAVSVGLTAQSVGVLAGTLRVGSRDYALTAIAINGPLPAAILEFDSSAVQSGQQRTVTMRLASAAPYAATGFLNIALQTDNGAADDPAVMFLPLGLRTIPFSVAQGATAITFGGQPSATFQTGSTAGRISFTVTGVPAGFANDPSVTLTMAPTPIVLDGATVVRSADHLDVVLTGFDNTFSIGAMTFSFFNQAGQPYGSAIAADFSAAFRAFFATGGGSVFRALISFPLSGDGAGIAGAEAQLQNSAGTVRTPRIAF